MQPQKLVIFGLQLCPINRKNRKSLETSRPTVFWEKFGIIPWNRLIIFKGGMKCVVLISFLVQNLITSILTSMNMNFSILKRNWKFKKTRDNSFAQIPSKSLTGKQNNPSLSTSRNITTMLNWNINNDVDVDRFWTVATQIKRI